MPSSTRMDALSYVSRTISNHPGRNLLISVDTHEEAAEAERMLAASGRRVIVLDEFSGPADRRTKNRMADEFRAAAEGTLAILRVKHPEPEMEEDLDDDEFTVIINPSMGTETFDFRP